MFTMGALFSGAMLLASGSSVYQLGYEASGQESAQAIEQPARQVTAKTHMIPINPDADSSDLIQPIETKAIESPEPSPVAPAPESLETTENSTVDTVVNVNNEAAVPQVTKQTTVPLPSAPARVAPAVIQPAPVAAKPAPAPVPAPVGRNIHVGVSGGQETVDRCIGPVLFPLPDPNIPVYIAEHDGCGGWQRIGTLTKGQTVNMSGLVKGTYTVQEIVTVKKKSNSDQINFSRNHSVVLQTCIPSTDWMVVVGLD